MHEPAQRPQLWRYGKLAVGWLMLAGGAVTAPLPLPIGQAVAVVGGCLVLSESRWARRLVKRARVRYPGADRYIARHKPRLPAFVRQPLDRTEPPARFRHAARAAK